MFFGDLCFDVRIIHQICIEFVSKIDSGSGGPNDFSGYRSNAASDILGAQALEAIC